MPPKEECLKINMLFKITEYLKKKNAPITKNASQNLLFAFIAVQRTSIKYLFRYIKAVGYESW